MAASRKLTLLTLMLALTAQATSQTTTSSTSSTSTTSTSGNSLASTVTTAGSTPQTASGGAGSLVTSCVSSIPAQSKQPTAFKFGFCPGQVTTPTPAASLPYCTSCALCSSTCCADKTCTPQSYTFGCDCTLGGAADSGAAGKQLTATCTALQVANNLTSFCTALKAHYKALESVTECLAFQTTMLSASYLKAFGCT